MSAEKGHSVNWLSTDEIRRVYDPARYTDPPHVGRKVLDTVAALCDEVDELRRVLVFADGFVVSQTRHTEFPMVLADLYNDTCPAAGVIQRAGCYPKGDMRRAAVCVCGPDGCDAEGEPGCELCRTLDSELPCPMEATDGR